MLWDRPKEHLLQTFDLAAPEILRQERVPGLSVALINDGELTGLRAYGLKNRETLEPVDVDTVFWAASLSKPIVAGAALRLWELGVLDLDQPLRAYLPSAYEPGDPQIDKITARMALSHTSGLPNWRPDGQALRTLRPPGERLGYSGEGFVYLQTVIERLTSETLDQHVRHTVLEPLGTASTSFVWKEEYDRRIAIGYRSDGTAHNVWKPDAANAAYSAYTTSGDIARLLLAVIGGGDLPGFFRPETRAAMTRPVVTYRHLPALGWALGWGTQETDDGRTFWQWGATPGFRSMAVAYSQRRFGVILMTNSDDGLRVCQRVLVEIVGGTYPVFNVIHVPTLGLDDQPAD
jgi:CubicO group peptidase (beta-lactamase class C family)